MFTKSSLDFLENFLNAPSPSGYEIAAAKVYRDYLSDCCEVTTDVMGNTIAALNTGAKMRVMLAGHYDEIGFQIVHIGDGGEIYFRNIGGIDKLNIPSSEVEILTANGRVPGVIGKKPIHLLKAKERDTAPELSDMWIDIGAESGEEARKLVSVGDSAVIKANFKMLNANRFISREPMTRSALSSWRKPCAPLPNANSTLPFTVSEPVRKKSAHAALTPVLTVLILILLLRWMWVSPPIYRISPKNFWVISNWEMVPF